MGRLCRILVVEDEALVAEDLAECLRAAGYEIVGSAPSGEEAVEKTRQTDPDLVLMDIRLQGKMDGIEAARSIRSFSDVPIIYISATTDPGILARAEITDPSGFLRKPFTETELFNHVETALD